MRDIAKPGAIKDQILIRLNKFIIHNGEDKGERLNSNIILL
jgi:hypothetical protein